jgi:hydrogenase-4 membrane subunit HyfE
MDIARKEGILALWTGINVTILRVILINIGQMASNDIIKTYLTSVPLLANHQLLARSISAVLASFITSAISLPVDNIKVKLQKSLKDESTYSGIFDCLRKTIAR